MIRDERAYDPTLWRELLGDQAPGNAQAVLRGLLSWMVEPVRSLRLRVAAELVRHFDRFTNGRWSLSAELEAQIVNFIRAGQLPPETWREFLAAGSFTGSALGYSIGGFTAAHTIRLPILMHAQAREILEALLKEGGDSGRNAAVNMTRFMASSGHQLLGVYRSPFAASPDEMAVLRRVFGLVVERYPDLPVVTRVYERSPGLVQTPAEIARSLRLGSQAGAG